MGNLNKKQKNSNKKKTNNNQNNTYNINNINKDVNNKEELNRMNKILKLKPNKPNTKEDILKYIENFVKNFNRKLIKDFFEESKFEKV